MIIGPKLLLNLVMYVSPVTLGNSQGEWDMPVYLLMHIHKHADFFLQTQYDAIDAWTAVIHSSVPSSFLLAVLNVREL